MNRFIQFYILLLLLSTLLIDGCYQGRPSKEPPIHINPNMDKQPKYRPQAESQFFADGATMRVPVAGTVARGELREDVPFYTGQDGAGNFIKGMPEAVEATPILLKRGQERYNIYCSPCHGRTGEGRGIVVNRGLLPPPTFHQDRFYQMSNGEIFSTMSNGIRNMPAYRFQVDVADRWAIISYIRALQRSQNASIEDIPQAMRDQVR